MCEREREFECVCGRESCKELCILRDLWFQSEFYVDVIESKRVLFLLQNLRERLIDTHPLSRWVHHLPPRPGERGVNVGERGVNG